MRTICLLITFTLFPSLSLAQVLIEEKYEYYQIAPKSKEEILTSLNHMSPVKNNGEVFHGYAYTAIKWDFLWKYNSISCWVTSVETKLTTTYTLPKLMSNVGVVNSIWREWFPNLVKHEKGHHGIAIEIAKRIEQEILNLPPQSTCKEVTEKGNEIGNFYIKKLSKAHKQYDKRTNNGQTQRASLHSHL